VTQRRRLPCDFTPIREGFIRGADNFLMLILLHVVVRLAQKKKARCGLKEKSTLCMTAT